jgi:RNA polymerase sigma-70 factor (ECF subfamily)
MHVVASFIVTVGFAARATDVAAVRTAHSDTAVAPPLRVIERAIASSLLGNSFEEVRTRVTPRNLALNHRGEVPGQEVVAAVIRDAKAVGRIPARPSNDMPPDGREGPVNTTIGAALADLVESARRGEAAGWDGLFDRFHPTVHRYALARTGDRTAAEEVAQEVFVAAVAALPRLRDRSEPAVEGWFIAIARNKLADRARRRSREQRVAVGPLTSPDAAELATSNLAAAELRRALDHLTDDQRDLLIRRFVLDHSLEQVAAATGRGVGAVKAMQHRALAVLEKRLTREGW